MSQTVKNKMSLIHIFIPLQAVFKTTLYQQTS